MRALLVPSGPVERALLVVATVFTVVGALHVLPLVATGGGWYGAVSWRKPIVFGVSIGVVTWWLAWVLGTLPWRRGVKVAWVAAYTAAMVVEYTVLTAQQWRGVASHFNGETAFDGVMFSVMGGAIATVSLLIVALTVGALRHPQRDRALRWSVLGGLVVMLGGLALGGVVVALGNAQAIDGTAPDTVRAGAAGVPKYAHAVALHVPQVLAGLLALAGGARLAPAARLRLLRRGVLGGAALVLATSVHTLYGRALTDLANPTGLALLAAGAACAWPFASAMMAAWRHDRTSTAPMEPVGPPDLPDLPDPLDPRGPAGPARRRQPKATMPR